MKPLTPQQEKFARLVAEGNNQSDAYRGSYNTSKMLPKSVTEKASELMANVNVSSRVAELRAEASKKTVITLESHIAELERLKELALEAGKFEAAIGAEVHRGKASGLYVVKTEDVTDPLKKAMGRMTPGDAQAALDALEQVRAIREKAKSAT